MYPCFLSKSKYYSFILNAILSIKISQKLASHLVNRPYWFFFLQNTIDLIDGRPNVTVTSRFISRHWHLFVAYCNWMNLYISAFMTSQNMILFLLTQWLCRAYSSITLLCTYFLLHLYHLQEMHHIYLWNYVWMEAAVSVLLWTIRYWIYVGPTFVPRNIYIL